MGTWVSFDGGYTREKVWDEVPYSARWHYHAMVEECVNGRRWDGVLPRAKALRCSDVPEPDADLAALVTAVLVTDDGPTVRIIYIDQHIPPEGQRAENLLPRKKANQQEYRRRKCERGEHDRHCPKGCPARTIRGGSPDGLPVTPGSGIGSGSGRESLPQNPALEEEGQKEASSLWPDVTVPGQRR